MTRGRVRLAVFLILLGGVVYMLSRLERALLFFPSVYPEGLWTPPDLAFQDAWFPSADGTRLHGWYVPAASGAPRAVVLYSHGNGGNLSYLDDVLRVLSRQLNVTALAYDYRGYGRSEGAPDVPGILADARAARAELAKRAGVAEADVVLLGRSLGGAVSVDLAGKDGARALILESTFSSLPDVAAVVYPWLPARWLMRFPLHSAEAIKGFKGPLLQAHGDRDELIPLALGRKLFDAANEPKTWVTVQGATHNWAPTAQWWQAVDAFLGRL